ncbi:uncharacterized protein OCT59_000603 [Rhizophagus irregularis]|uniref:uncharacterized protein n=1 Tax=Rhizophagus irregularis TaxID=588596 RepID=UPI00332971FD|nr:hypothetical protein OCT59_000603 [Rhizophagus irregularis]
MMEEISSRNFTIDSNHSIQADKVFNEAPEPTYCDDRQIIPTARRVCYSAFLTATRTSIISVMYTVLARRKYNN